MQLYSHRLWFRNWIVEDIDTCAIEVCLVKNLVDSPNRWWDFGSPYTRGNVPRFISTDYGVCTTCGSWVKNNIFLSSDSVGRLTIKSEFRLKKCDNSNKKIIQWKTIIQIPFLCPRIPKKIHLRPQEFTFVLCGSLF